METGGPEGDAAAMAVALALVDAIDRAADRAEGAASGACEPVTDAVRARRRARSVELDEIADAVRVGRHLTLGYRSPTDWLTAISLDPAGQCRLTVRLALGRDRTPLVRAAFAAGDLSESALRLLVDTWNPDIAHAYAADEHRLVRWATTFAFDDFKMLLERWRAYVDPDGHAEAAAERFDRRRFHLSPLLDGMHQLDGLLDAEGAGYVRKAISALAGRTRLDGRTAAQARADGLVAVAKFALDHLHPEVGRKRSRHRVVGTATIADMVAGTGAGALDTDGVANVVPIETIRRMACDCSIHRLFADPAGHVIDYGRATRTVSDPLFELLTLRDHHCRFPGCTTVATACDAHHAVHWLGPDGERGETEPDNLVLLCWHHHRMVHEQHWSIQPCGAGHFILHDRHGRSHPMRPPLVGAGLPHERPPQLPLTG